MGDTLIFERNDYLYMVGAVAPIQPTVSEIAELAFAQQLKESNPNGNLLWLRGQYVEGGRPNENGQTWRSEDLAITSLTPRLMPVTVMHDPSTAVGLIADTKLLTAAANNVPRDRIDTVLAVWQHRFPEIAEEVAINYAQGTLMQSMECDISHYECLDCGRGFVKLPKGAERANWCDHLRESAEKGTAPRRLLRDPNFTGTGLIFGTRNGAKGALDVAHLEVAEVAEFHERARTERRTPRRVSVDEITIKRSEYDALVAKAGAAEAAAAKVTTLDAEVSTLTKANEKLEIDLQAKTTEAATEKAARETLEETARSQELSSTRYATLGEVFLTKLPETIKVKLQEQAKAMSDEDWTSRIEDLELMAGVKADEKAPEGTVTAAETARSQMGGGAPASSAAPARREVSSVFAGIFEQNRPARPTPPASK